MAMGSGLVALAMLAAEGQSCSPDETTTFQVRVLTLDGLEWRTSSYYRLQPVARQGSLGDLDGRPSPGGLACRTRPVGHDLRQAHRPSARLL